MRGERRNERARLRGFLAISAIFLAILVLKPAQTGMKVVIDEAVFSVEMTAPFFRMAFDIGQERSKTNSVRISIG